MADLAEALRRTDPAALLVPARILRRVIKKDRGLGGVGLQVPHRKSYVIGRDALLAIADRGELGLPPGRDLPATLLLIGEPDTRRLAAAGLPEALLRLWRLLFHARVHAEIDRLFADGKRTEADVRARVAALGETEFDEARSVLRQERLLLPPPGPRTAYAEFAATYLELRYFDRRKLPRYFPALASSESVDRLLAADVDAEALFRATRPEGAADPAEGEPEEDAAGPVTGPAEAEEAAPAPAGSETCVRLLETADPARRAGNVVRAAIRARRAATVGDPRLREEALAAADRDLDRLTIRFQRALGIGLDEARRWREALGALLGPAAAGTWTPEGRLLYDLQKVCTDFEREVYAVDLVEWLLSLGRRPVKRHLPNQRLVLMVRHLRGAAHRLPGVRLPYGERRKLIDLILEAEHRTEERLRDQLRVPLRNALGEVGLAPANFAERVSRDKLVEELLDLIARNGHFAMSDLRDAVARNRLKLPDLSGPGEFLFGDRLIRANRAVAVPLDGVYRRGEVYLRWLQRLSAAAFGTHTGRFLTRYVALPFGGAYVLLEFIQLVIHEVTRKHVRLSLPVAPVLHFRALSAHERVDLGKIPLVLLLGLVLMGLLYAPRFRQAVVGALRGVWRGLRLLSYEVPAAFLNLPVVRRVLQSRLYFLVYQLVLKPFVLAAPVSLALVWRGDGLAPALVAGAAVYLAAGLLLNSRLGIRAEEYAADQAVRGWYLIRRDLLPGLLHMIEDVFKRLLERIERGLYAVDERLRFRTGDSPLSAAVKAVLGVFWFVITYLVRVVVNLSLEPTFNPIKHFPVVTVAAKVTFPLIPALTYVLEPVLGTAVAVPVATGAHALVSGFAGFLAWELKENWKLFRANMPPALRPVMVGSHGETVARLLRPGFHSGTLPKLFAKLRHADGRSARKRYEALHHVREAVRHFAERELLAVLAGSRAWGGGLRLRVGGIELGTNRIRVGLHGRDVVGDDFAFEFAEQSGWLQARVARPGWLAHLSPGQRRALHNALAGFYHLAGVELVGEQLDALLPAGTAHEVADEGLAVWPRDGFGWEAVYDLAAGPELLPAPFRGVVPDDLPPLRGEDVFYHEQPVDWADWVRAWERDRDGKDDVTLLPGVRLLPG
jgi:hypothetical protein